MMAVIEAPEFRKRFGKPMALDGLDLAVEPGQVVAVLGSNGAGKTTTMRLIPGPGAPDSGTVTVHGRPYRHSPAPTRDVGALPEARAAHGGRGGLPGGQLAEVIAHVALGVFTSYAAAAARACTGRPLANQPTIH